VYELRSNVHKVRLQADLCFRSTVRHWSRDRK